MKKSIVYIIAIAALAIAAWWLVQKNQKNSSIADLEVQYDFAVVDTGAVTRIEISDKVPSEVILERTETGWQVNEQYKARPDAIEVLLETMHRQSMRSFVPEPATSTIINRLAVYGKEVKVYAGDELVKHFIVGTETPDQLGTYMMLEGAKLPFAVHIQGFNGYLSSRFFTEEELWRERSIFGLPIKDITEVKLVYQENGAISPSESFRIDNTGSQPVLYDLNGNQVFGVQPVNMNIFLGSIRTVKYEGMIVPTDGIYSRRDSMQNSQPVFILSVTDKNGANYELRAHRKRPDSREEVDEDGLPLEWDKDRMYAFLSDGRWILVQYYGMRNVIVTKAFFGLELNTDN